MIEFTANKTLSDKNNTLRVILTHGKYTLIDEKDYPLVKNFRWLLAKSKRTFYVVAHKTTNGKTIHYRMSRVLCNLKNDNLQVDHIDRNGLNNTRKNLRIVTASENNFNRRKWKWSKNFRTASAQAENKPGAPPNPNPHAPGPVLEVVQHARQIKRR